MLNDIPSVGVTALRPTFGSFGRTGVMSISESIVWQNSNGLRKRVKT